MPDEARPDRSGLLVSLNFEQAPRNCLEGMSITVRALSNNGPIASSMAAAVLDSVCDRLVPVWFSDGAKKMLMYPDKEIAQLVLSGETAPAHLEGEVATWRERYGAFSSETDATL